MTEDELAAARAALSTRQRQYMAVFIDWDVHYIPKRTGEALVRRGYLSEKKTIVTAVTYVNEDGELTRSYPDGDIQIEFWATTRGRELALYLDRINREQLAPRKRA